MSEYSASSSEGSSPPHGGQLPSRYETNHVDTEGGVMVFYPTMEEFSNFSNYIRLIENARGHESCGIAKIIPPPEWHPRPRRKDDNYADADEYEINEPVREKITGDKGCYTKFNTVVKQKMTVKEFKQLATSKEYSPPSLGDNTIKDIERAYWRATTIHESIYGADTPGSLFDKEVDAWNVNHLGSILDLIEEEGIKIKGVNTAYLYFGMWKTTFPWHIEDVDLYAINYLHYGAPKFWYGVADKHADKLEAVAKQYFAESHRECKQFLRHKMYLMSPTVLNFNHVPFGRCIHRPGEFMITFPRGYHQGFNLGYNCAESTNFGSERWVPIGAEAKLCHCREDSVQIDMQPFMRKYRPYEYEEWSKFFYGGDGGRDDEGEEESTPKLKKMERSMHPMIRNEMHNKKAKKAAEVEKEEEPKVFKTSIKARAETKGGKRTILRDEEYLPMLDPEYRDHQTPVELWRNRLARLWHDRSLNRQIFSCEMKYNAEMGKHAPYCSVCQYFVPRDKRGKALIALNPNPEPAHYKSYIKQHSRRIVNDIMFVRDPEKIADTTMNTRKLHFVEPIMLPNGKPMSLEEPEAGDTLMRCDVCGVCVHASCMHVADASAKEYLHSGTWRCYRCRDNPKPNVQEKVKCRLCVLRGGAMVPCNDFGFVHVVCAMFAHEQATFIAKPGIDCWVVRMSSEDEAETERKSSCGSKEGKEPTAKRARKKYVELADIDDPDYGLLPDPNAGCDGLYNCYLCRTPRGHLQPCSACPADDVLCCHITCGLHIGVTYEQKDWPLLLAVTCTQHEGQTKKDLRYLKVDEAVVAWIDKGVEVQRGIVKEMLDNVYCVVDFLDGTSTNDSYMTDIKWCDCGQYLGRPCDGKHVFGSSVTVEWEERDEEGNVTSSEKHTGEFQRAINAVTYKVLLRDGRTKELKRDELYAEEELLPDTVKERLQTYDVENGVSVEDSIAVVIAAE